MKPFNIKEYNNPSRKIMTGEGIPVRILCTDVKRDYPIITLIEDNGKEYIRNFLLDGTTGVNTNEKYHLFFAPEKHEGYVNLFRQTAGINAGFVFNTKEEAEKSAKGIPCYITTTKIEWEE